MSATGGTRWSASWCEQVIPCWLIVILLLVGPIEVGVRRLFKVIKQRQVALKEREPSAGGTPSRTLCQEPPAQRGTSTGWSTALKSASFLSNSESLNTGTASSIAMS